MNENLRNLNYQICTRCVMDTSDPLIEFDQIGHCNLCSDFLQNRKNVINYQHESLKILFDDVKRRSKKNRYDCIIGVSGGVDSSYLMVLAKKFGLRVLAVHMDNGWNSPTAVKNIKELVQKLNFDYVSYVLPWAEFKRVQVSFLKASVPEAETPTDVAIGRAVHHYALKTKTKYILSGGNIASEGILPMSWHYNCRDTSYTYDVLKKNGGNKKDFSSQKFGFIDEVYCKIIKNIKILYPLNYYDYNKELAKKELEQDFGWTYYGSKHGESKYTKFIQRYYLVKKHGIDYRRATLSSEICLGKVKREEALEILKQPYYEGDNINEEMEFISKKLSIDLTELDEILNSEARWFYDYKNSMNFLHFFYDLYRKIYGKAKTSNH